MCVPMFCLLGASEVTENLYCNCVVLGRLRDLQYIFAVTYETLCTLCNPPNCLYLHELRILQIWALSAPDTVITGTYTRHGNALCYIHSYTGVYIVHFDYQNL